MERIQGNQQCTLRLAVGESMSTSVQEGQSLVPGTRAGCSKERAAPRAQPQLEKSECPRKLGEWDPGAEILDLTIALFLPMSPIWPKLSGRRCCRSREPFDEVYAGCRAIEKGRA